MTKDSSESRTLRVVICGAGNRVFPKNPANSLFRGWFETLRRSPKFEVVGVQDIAAASIGRVKQAYALDGIPTFQDLSEALSSAPCDAVLICPVAEAHAAAALTAIEAGRHVLIEKPLVTVLADAVRVQRESEKRGVVVSVVQNWRAKSVGIALRAALQSKRIGAVGNVFFRYVRDREQPHLPAYLFREPFPLLYAMSIHHFDLFRYALGENIVTIEGNGFTPPWSRYESPPGVHLSMKTDSGIHISYIGTFSSRNRHIAQESLIVDGETGSLSNDSQWGDPPLLLSGGKDGATTDLTEGESRDVRDQYNDADDYYLNDFWRAVCSGGTPLCPPADNLWSLAAVDAAAQACRTGAPVDVRTLVKRAVADVDEAVELAR